MPINGPRGVFKTTDVPDEELDNVVAGYQLNKPTSIEKIKQPDGKWTVIATFPDTPEEPGQSAPQAGPINRP